MPEQIDRFTPRDQLPELMRVAEYAAFHDVSKGIVYELIRRGKLPCIRLGRLVRIHRDAQITEAR